MKSVAQGVRLTALVCVAAAGACAHGAQATSRLVAEPIGVTLPVSAVLHGTVHPGPDAVQLRITRGAIHVAAGPSTAIPAITELSEVAIRAVLVSDSAGRFIPIGVSGAYTVDGTVRAGESRSVNGVDFALPAPDGVRLTEVWVAFEVSGQARAADGRNSPVSSLVCSAAPLAASRSEATLRLAQRMRANYQDACRL